MFEVLRLFAVPSWEPGHGPRDAGDDRRTRPGSRSSRFRERSRARAGSARRPASGCAEVAARLGYRRPAPAEPKPLGVVFNDTDVINSELHMQIQGGVQREAQRLGFPVRVHWTHRARISRRWRAPAPG